jgi:hypothetical protein
VQDLYGVARALGVELWDAGHPEWSRRIDDIVAGGATGTEILMGLRGLLGELLGEVPALPAGLRRRIASLRHDIADTLGMPS